MHSSQTTASKPGPWLLTKIVAKDGSTQYAVARPFGASLEYVKSASGRTSTFKTREAAKRVLRCAKAEAGGA